MRTSRAFDLIMASTATIRQEFEIWLEHLTAGLTKLQSLIDFDPVKKAKLLEIFEELEIDSETLNVSPSSELDEISAIQFLYCNCSTSFL